MPVTEKIEKLQNILRNDSTNFQARRELAILLLDNGFNDEALAHFLKLAQVFKDDSALFYNIGITYEKLKQFPNAIKAYKKAIELNPDDVDAMYNLGLVYSSNKNYSKAIDCFETVLDNDTNDSNTYFNIGYCYFKLEKFDSARYYFERAVELNSEDLYAHFYLGNIYLKDDADELAQNEFEKVLTISPDYSWAYYNLAVIDYRATDYTNALEKLNKTIFYNPKDIEAYKIQVKILLKLNEFEQVIDTVSSAISKCGENGDLFYLLSEAYKNLGQTDRQKEAISLAIKNYNTLNADLTILKDELNNLK